MKTLVLLGGGDLAREIESYIVASGEFLDRSLAHSSSIKPRVICPNYILMDIIKALPSGADALICVGDPYVKETLNKEFGEHVNYINYISNRALCTSKIESNGVILNPGSITTVNVRLGNHVLIQNNAVIGHDVSIGDYSTISPLVMVGGHASIGKRCYIGAGAFVKEGLTICDDVVIGGNAAVVRDINVPGTYVGVPAKLVGTGRQVFNSRK